MFFVSIFSGCKAEKDYVVKADWVYINNSSQSLKVTGLEVFDLDVAATKTLSYNIDGPETVAESNYVAPFKSGTTKIIVAGREFTDTKITDREHYIAERVAERHYKFTYTFTDADFPEE